MNNNNKSQFLSTREAITEWLDKYHIKNYTINDDLSVDVKGNVNITTHNLKIIPIKFGNVTGDFWCNNNKLVSLVGAPEEIGGSFSCNNNKLTNLLGSPKSIARNFFCDHNKLLNLIGSPEIVGGGFNCSGNQLTNLAGSPVLIAGNFWCNDNKSISLEGSPKTVGGSFACLSSALTSLLEIIDCNFKENIYFNIDERNFKQKELIKILKKYYDSGHKCYKLTNHQFNDTIKPVLEKEILEQKLQNSRIKNKIKSSFI